jgi:hypothetical protein
VHIPGGENGSGGGGVNAKTIKKKLILKTTGKNKT